MNSDTKENLNHILESAGVDNKEWWLSELDASGDSQPLVEMALFLRECWRPVLDVAKTGWIDQCIDGLRDSATREDLYSLRFQGGNPDLLASFERLQESGACENDVLSIVRHFQLEVLVNVIGLIDGGHTFEKGLESDWVMASVGRDMSIQQEFSDLKYLFWQFGSSKSVSKNDSSKPRGAKT